jgi:hypothetical protein
LATLVVVLVDLIVPVSGYDVLVTVVWVLFPALSADVLALVAVWSPSDCVAVPVVAVLETTLGEAGCIIVVVSCVVVSWLGDCAMAAPVIVTSAAALASRNLVMGGALSKSIARNVPR